MKNKNGLFGIIILATALVIIFAGVLLYFLVKNLGLTVTKGDIVVELGNNKDGESFEKPADITSNNNTLLIEENNISEADENLTNITNDINN